MQKGKTKMENGNIFCYHKNFPCIVSLIPIKNHMRKMLLTRFWQKMKQAYDHMVPEWKNR